MYLDAVLVTATMKPVFNDTPMNVRNTLQGLMDQFPQFADNFSVCVGETMKLLSVEEYLARRTLLPEKEVKARGLDNGWALMDEGYDKGGHYRA